MSENKDLAKEVKEQFKKADDVDKEIIKEKLFNKLKKLEPNCTDDEKIKTIIKRSLKLSDGYQNRIIDELSKLNYYDKWTLKGYRDELQEEGAGRKKVEKDGKKLILPNIEITNESIYFKKFNGEVDVIVKEVPFYYKINNKIWNHKSKTVSYFAKEIDTAEPTLLPVNVIRSVLKDNGANNREVNDFLNFLSLDPAIEPIETIGYFGYYPEEEELKLPQDYIANNPTGYGLEFFEDFFNSKKTYKKGRETWFNLIREAEKGISREKALIIASFSVASLFQNVFIQEVGIAPYLALIGPVETGKTPAAKYIGNIVKCKILHSGGELTPAIYSQLGSAGAFPLVIDEADELRDEVKNTIKINATSEDNRRRRANQDGSRRDAPKFLRTLIMTANHIPAFMQNSQAILSRTIFVEFEKMPENKKNWDEAKKAFIKTEESFANYLLYADVNYKELLEKSKKKIEGIESEKDIQFSNRKRGIFTFIAFGLLILQETNYFGGDENVDDILIKIRDLIDKSGKIANEETIDHLKTYITKFHKNYQDWQELEILVDSANIPEEFIATYISNRNRLAKQPMAITKNFHWTLRNFEMSRIYRNTHLDAFKNLESLRRALKNSNIRCETKTTRSDLQEDSYKAIHINQEDLNIEKEENKEEVKRELLRLFEDTNKDKLERKGILQILDVNLGSLNEEKIENQIKKIIENEKFFEQKNKYIHYHDPEANTLYEDSEYCEDPNMKRKNELDKFFDKN